MFIPLKPTFQIKKKSACYFDSYSLYHINGHVIKLQEIALYKLSLEKDREFPKSTSDVFNMMDACHSPNTLLSIAHCQAFRILTWQTTIDGTSLSTSGDTYGNSAGRVLETVTGTNWPKYSWYHRRKYKLSAPNQQVNRMYLFYYQINIKSLNIILLQLDSSVSFFKGNKH